MTSNSGNDNISKVHKIGNITINAGAGNDKILVDDIVGNVTIDAGTGNDNVNVEDVQGNVSVLGGSGNDKIKIDDIHGNVTVNAGSGNDSIEITDVVGAISVTLGDGNDSLLAKRNMGAINVAGNAGNDYIVLDGQQGNVTFDTGAGNDVVLMDDINGVVSVSAGTGNDIILIDDAIGNVTVNGGDGNDIIVANHVTGGTATLRGDAGSDLLNGGAGNEIFVGGKGNDLIEGAGGVADKVILTGNRADYTITKIATHAYKIQDNVNNRDGVDVVNNVELFQFANGTVAEANILGQPINHVPIAVNDSSTINEDAAITLNVLANDLDPDNDPLSVTNAVLLSGLGTVVRNANGTITYTPTADFNGEASIQYTITDGISGTSTAIWNITVNPVNDAPIAVDETLTTAKNTAVNIPVLVNDTDADNDVLTVTQVTLVTPGAGTVVINPDNTIQFNPSLNFTGPVVINYSVSDGQVTDVGQVNITVATGIFDGTNNTVNLNNFTDVTNVPDIYSSGFGDDVIILPDVAPVGYDAQIIFDAGAGDDTITGGTLDDRILGNVGDDIMYGGDGSDVIQGGRGNDIAYGGSQPASVSSFSLMALSATSFDSYVLAGTEFDYGVQVVTDSFSTSGFEFTGLGGFASDGTDQIYNFDYVIYSDGIVNSTSTLETPGLLFTNLDDTFDFNPFLTTMGTDATTIAGRYNAGGGNDTVTLSGNLVAVGDIGFVYNPNVEFHGDSGNDEVFGSGLSETISGDEGNDILHGGGGNDILNGGIDGNDTLDGGDGDDFLVYYSGNDTIDGGLGDDAVDFTHYGDEGMHVFLDTTIYFTDNFTFSGSINGVENVLGTLLADQIEGNLEANTFRAFDGNDSMNGNGGDDTLIGGLGDDQLTGGDGNDTFVFDIAFGAGSAEGHDTITDIIDGETLRFMGANNLQFDFEANVAVIDNGAGNSVTINFNNGDTITLLGAGTAGNTISNLDQLDNHYNVQFL